MTDDIYCHVNGLQHINLIDNEGFSALFVVNTPIFDNSGVAHGVEHMVFRRSTAFSQPETLFQLTSLTDAKINASTFAHNTYFHCQSQCYHTFMLAINYLLNGLFDPIFDTEDLRCEIYDGGNKGVIYQELIGIEQANNTGTQSTQENDNNQFSYGGISALIGDLSLNDLIAFHQHYYQASNITLVTANANVEQIAYLIDLLPTQTDQSTQVKMAVEKHRKQSQSREQNNAQGNEQHQKKYSPAINKLITVYHSWLQDPYYQEIEDYQEIDSANKRVDTNRDTLLAAPQSNLIPALINLSNKLIKKGINDKTVTMGIIKSANKALLPHLFTKLCLQAKQHLMRNKSNSDQLNSDQLNSNQLNSNEKIYARNIAYATDQRNALWLTNIETADEVIANITSYIISAYPNFLAPRCQGLCYATQALTIENSAYLAIYSAFDVSPDNRLKELSHCLLKLSQDNGFISMSLALAKIKYYRAYQVGNSLLNDNQVMDIACNDISSYLKLLANRALITVSL